MIRVPESSAGTRAAPALALIVCVAILAQLAWAAGGAGGVQMPWWDMGMKLLGGLALFLFGMEQMAEALKAVAGERMRDILAKLTTNRFMGVATGAFVTAVIQSSSVTTVLVVGFITAGLMSMSQSIGVIMGANIGTTITAQIVAFKVTKAALPMIAVGFGMLFFSKKQAIRHYGAMLMGLGMIFFGMSVMSDAMAPLRSYPPFLDLMARMENPLVGILIAAAFTALVQSSSATTGIVIVMAAQGFITLPAGIALAFGANIGTCVTAILASIGKPREAVRAALAHVLFNVLGVLVWLAFIPYLAQMVVTLSPTHADLSGIERLAAEVPRQIANAHTIFNIANTLIFIGFAGHLARLVERLVPDKPIEEVVTVKARYLSEELIDTPSLALQQVRLELRHVGEYVQQMNDKVMPAILAGDRRALLEVRRIDDTVDALHGEVLTYLGKVSNKSLIAEQSRTLTTLMGAANDLENIGDLIETDLVALGLKSIDERVHISKPTQKVLVNLHRAVSEAAEQSLHALMLNDGEAAAKVIAMKGEIAGLMDSAAMHQLKRLVAKEPNRLAAYTVEIDIMEKLKRIYYFSKRIAKAVDSGAATEPTAQAA